MPRIAETAAVLVCAAAAALAATGAATAHTEAGAPAARSAGAAARSPLEIPVDRCGDAPGPAGLLNPAVGETRAHGG
ncbi:DUF320 domain-containing protein [Streptomyces sp. MRC013]|uniref:chaplin family protein n=1 Tax=Streptomyces sp. MRC013 TaxID=2898276 RepID=UPI0020271BBB|nr:chaplin family protein [Streptomyces sp. MRC013]URM90320.1 DUF320 domain-containing protein [Streptomyces sp. MRC013]